MFSLKKSNVVLLLTFFLISGLYAVGGPASIVTAAAPVRIAVLPIVDKAEYQDQGINQFILWNIIERLLDPRHDIALNIQVENALTEITQGKKITELPGKQLLQNTADKLSADVVVAVELTQASSMVFTSAFTFDNDIEIKRVTVSCAVYMKKDDKYITYTSFQTETTEPEYNAGIQRLTENCMHDITKKIVSTLKQNELW